MRSYLQKILNLNITNHLIIAFALRAILILYGGFHDDFFKVSYTDVDYKVFTDGARHVLSGDSPYRRHTYRYSPMLALLMTPNVLVNYSFGKWFFSLFDILAGFVIYKIVKHNITSEVERSLKKDHVKSFQNEIEQMKNVDIRANISALSWLYNPLVFIISTRGNCDAIASVFVLLTIYLLQCRKLPFLAGLVHGFVIHFRLYPLMYSLSLYMHLSNFSYYTENKIVTKHSKDGMKKTIFKKDYVNYLIPNLNQLKLVFGTLLTLISFTVIFYVIYGYEFLFETYLYHFIRKDTRHNFSLYFYMQYLSAGIKNISYWQRVLTVLPQYLLISVLSIHCGLNKSALSFSLFTVTFVMVSYNTVLTSQYFMWLMVILPLCMWQLRMSKSLASLLLAVWLISQMAWLLPAYLLEFQGRNTFIFIWIQSVAFFSANIGILGRIIHHFKSSEF